MSDTTEQDCNCCGVESDCINGLCESCSDYNYILEAKNKKLKKKIARIKRLQKRYADNSRCLITMGYTAKDIEQALKL